MIGIISIRLSAAYDLDHHHLLPSTISSIHMDCIFSHARSSSLPYAPEKASNYVEINFSDGQVIAVEKEEIKAGTDAEKKAQIDKKLYKKLSEKSGKTLAWGILARQSPMPILLFLR